MSRIYIAGVDIDFTEAVVKANKGKSVIFPSSENGKPVLECWNFPKKSVARQQLTEIAKEFSKNSVRFYSNKQGHICTLVVV